MSLISYSSFYPSTLPKVIAKQNLETLSQFERGQKPLMSSDTISVDLNSSKLWRYWQGAFNPEVITKTFETVKERKDLQPLVQGALQGLSVIRLTYLDEAEKCSLEVERRSKLSTAEKIQKIYKEYSEFFSSKDDSPKQEARVSVRDRIAYFSGRPPSSQSFSKQEDKLPEVPKPPILKSKKLQQPTKRVQITPIPIAASSSHPASSVSPVSERAAEILCSDAQKRLEKVTKKKTKKKAICAYIEKSRLKKMFKGKQKKRQEEKQTGSLAEELKEKFKGLDLSCIYKDFEKRLKKQQKKRIQERRNENAARVFNTRLLQAAGQGSSSSDQSGDDSQGENDWVTTDVQHEMPPLREVIEVRREIHSKPRLLSRSVSVYGAEIQTAKRLSVQGKDLAAALASIRTAVAYSDDDI